MLGFSLDASPDLINQAYIVSAHVQEVSPRGRWCVAEEKFTALCLPGMLPGFFMSYNHHGFAYCVNTISTGVEVTDKQTRKISHWGKPEVHFSGNQTFRNFDHF